MYGSRFGSFRSVKQHVASCSFLRTGVACCLPMCARGVSFSCTELLGKGSFLAFWLLLVHPGCTSFVGYPLVCTRFGFQRCASCWTRPVGGGRWRHYLCYPWRVRWAAHKTANQMCSGVFGFHCLKLYMPALVGRPSLHSYDACMVYWIQGASRRDCRQKHGKTSFTPEKGFSV